MKEREPFFGSVEQKTTIPDAALASISLMRRRIRQEIVDNESITLLREQISQSSSTQTCEPLDNIEEFENDNLEASYRLRSEDLNRAMASRII